MYSGVVEVGRLDISTRASVDNTFFQYEATSPWPVVELSTILHTLLCLGLVTGLHTQQYK